MKVLVFLHIIVQRYLAEWVCGAVCKGGWEWQGLAVVIRYVKDFCAYCGVPHEG